MVLLYRSSSDSAALWLAELRRHIPELEMRVFPEIGDPRDIDAALVWKPQPGLLASLPNLKMIVSLGAGVDHLLEDATLPRHVPIVRLVDPYMTEAMSEYVLSQVLRLHRRDLEYRAQQEERIWKELPQPNAAARRVGVRHFITEDLQDRFGLDAVTFVNPFKSANDQLIDNILPP